MISLSRIPYWAYCRGQEKFSSMRWMLGSQPDRIFEEITKVKPSDIKSLSGEGQNNQSWYVRHKQKEYKLFRLLYEQYSDQICQLTKRLQRSGLIMPQFIGSDKTKSYIVSEWVSGRTIKPSDVAGNPDVLKQIAKLQANTNSIDDFVPSVKHEDFFYLNKIIIPRYLYWTTVRFGGKLQDINCRIIDSIKKRLGSIQKNRKMVITNPDFSLNNLIYSDSGDVVVIDTEFMAVDRGADLEMANFLNKLKRISPDIEHKYIEYYESYRPLEQFHQERDFWDACITLRHLGKQAKYLRVNENHLWRGINRLQEVFCDV